MKLKYPVSVPTNVFNPGTDALDLGYPWITPEAALKLVDIVDSDDDVLDLGTGGSTLFYIRRCSTVVGLETERTWYPRVAEAIKGIENVSVTLFEADEYTRIHTELTTQTMAKLLAWLEADVQCYDVISVDTMHYYNRSALLDAVLPRWKPNGILVMDNWRCAGLWPKHNHLRPDELLDMLGVATADFAVLDSVLPGWSGSGTRLVVSRSRLEETAAS